MGNSMAELLHFKRVTCIGIGKGDVMSRLISAIMDHLSDAIPISMTMYPGMLSMHIISIKNYGRNEVVSYCN